MKHCIADAEKDVDMKKLKPEEAIAILKANYPDVYYEQLREAFDMAIYALQAQDVHDINIGDMVSRQKAIDALCSKCTVDKPGTCSTIQDGDRWCEEVYTLLNLPSTQPEYEPVKAEDFAKTMSENTFYGFMVWHSEALELMERQGFVICKKTL